MKDIIELYFNDPDMLVIRSAYENIRNSHMEIGFRSEKINGKDVHKINRDIVISIQRFHEGVITNLVFSNGQAFRLELLDNEIIPYYSDYIEIRYIISGHLVLDVEGQKAVFKEGDVCFIHSKAYHHEIVSESYSPSSIVLRYREDASVEERERINTSVFNLLDDCPEPWEFCLYEYEPYMERPLAKVSGSCIYQAES